MHTLGLDDMDKFGDSTGVVEPDERAARRQPSPKRPTRN